MESFKDKRKKVNQLFYKIHSFLVQILKKMLLQFLYREGIKKIDILLKSASKTKDIFQNYKINFKKVKKIGSNKVTHRLTA